MRKCRYTFVCDGCEIEVTDMNPQWLNFEIYDNNHALHVIDICGMCAGTMTVATLMGKVRNGVN